MEQPSRRVKQEKGGGVEEGVGVRLGVFEELGLGLGVGLGVTGVHKGAPAFENVPLGHILQVESKEAPELLLKVPAGQRVAFTEKRGQ